LKPGTVVNHAGRSRKRYRRLLRQPVQLGRELFHLILRFASRREVKALKQRSQVSSKVSRKLKTNGQKQF
jgi:hypothetical protein